MVGRDQSSAPFTEHPDTAQVQGGPREGQEWGILWDCGFGDPPVLGGQQLQQQQLHSSQTLSHHPAHPAWPRSSAAPGICISNLSCSCPGLGREDTAVLPHKPCPQAPKTHRILLTGFSSRSHLPVPAGHKDGTDRPCSGYASRAGGEGQLLPLFPDTASSGGKQTLHLLGTGDAPERGRKRNQLSQSFRERRANIRPGKGGNR